MGFLSTLKRFLGEPLAVASLGSAESVSALLPPEVVYASAGAIGILRDAEEFNGGPPGEGAYGRDLGWLPQDQRPALLARTADSLLVVTADGVSWQRPLDDIVAVDAHRRGGFLVFLRDGSGLAVSVQTPVRTPPDRVLRTVPRVSNQFAGWESELDVPHHW